MTDLLRERVTPSLRRQQKHYLHGNEELRTPMLLQSMYLLHQATCELESSEIVVVHSNTTYALNAAKTEDIFSDMDIVPINLQVSTPQPYDTEVMKMRAELEKESISSTIKEAWWTWSYIILIIGGTSLVVPHNNDSNNPMYLHKMNSSNRTSATTLSSG
ncbi:unnamed protein product [Hermetia illucens]|uniref:Uncharacterized protein n=1 Tax=Hermetia illucens TaxID=343691 RepID=A0A7R8UVB1_HERIL|nr:unnamed protein product [Hermetia illucens]